MGRLGDKLKKEDTVVKTEKKTTPEKSTGVVKKISGGVEKDKQISAKVNSLVYSQFCEINKKEGMSNNSVINMLVNRYVREKKYLLEDE